MRKKVYIAGIFTLASLALAAIPKAANFIADQICRLIPEDKDEADE